jgi:hypothetical protein
MQKGGGKGVLDKLMEKCIGAGCNSTRPFLPPTQTRPTAVVEKEPLPSSTTPTTVSKPPVVDRLPPYMTKDIKPLREKFAQITPENNATDNLITQETYPDSSTIVDDGINVPFIPFKTEDVKIQESPFNDENKKSTIPCPPPPPQNKVEDSHRYFGLEKKNTVVNQTPINFTEHVETKASQSNKLSSVNSVEKAQEVKQTFYFEGLKKESCIYAFKEKNKEELTLSGWNKTKESFYLLLLDYYQHINSVEQFFETRDVEEKRKIEELFTDNINTNIIAHLDKEIFNTCYTLEHFEKELARIQELKVILEHSGMLLSDIVVHELVRRAGITINNDVMPDGEFIHERIIEGQGATLHQDAYKIIKNNPDKYYIQIQKLLDNSTLDIIFKKVINKEFHVVIIDPQYFITFQNSDKIIDSGDEVHMHLVVNVELEGQMHYFSVLTYTSTKDNDTVELTKKQYIAPSKEPIAKAQLCRPLETIIEIPENMIKKPATEHEKNIEIQMQMYTHNNNCEGKNIPEKLKNEILKKEHYLRENKPRELLIITKQKIINLSIDKCVQRETNLLEQKNNIEAEFNSFNPQKRDEEITLRENQYKNIQKTKKEVAVLREMPKDIAKDYRELQKEKKNAKPPKKKF